MSTPPPPTDGLDARDLDRHLINRAGILVDATTLDELPVTRLSGASPILLATGSPVPVGVPAPLLRLLMRTSSIAVPCALVADRPDWQNVAVRLLATVAAAPDLLRAPTRAGR
ncbi:hypothetical protein P3T27_005943 [Kitasatospora sp. MAA19]|uniref:hypothetical protein n=1 Tax=unclassified Kitasatospora TaxID=2633591 RepID=UPI0024740AC3|nr:hypothetical protein [Kitasatospora sp. MAA19]MDH6709197.1 hypothetical protein [Kitasatospora sp. MAA19]